MSPCKYFRCAAQSTVDLHFGYVIRTIVTVKTIWYCFSKIILNTYCLFSRQVLQIMDQHIEDMGVQGAALQLIFWLTHAGM